MAYTVEEFKRDAMRDLLDEVVRDPKHLKTALDRLVEEAWLKQTEHSGD
jgi:arginine decarboxylase-like protein